MPDKSMNAVIHAAIRRDVDRFGAALADFRDADRARAKQLGLAWRQFYGQLTRHHEGEHEIAWPAMRAVGVADDVIGQMDAEHESLAAALGEADTALTALAASATAADGQAAAASVATLKAVVEQHFDHEERELEPVYQSKRDAPEIKAMGKAFAREAGPAQSGEFFAWLLDGASAEDRAALRGTIPGPVLAIITKVFGRKYSKTIAPVWR